MNNKLVLCILSFCAHVHSVHVTFSPVPEKGHKSVEVLPGSLSHKFTKDNIHFNDQDQTYMTLTTTSDSDEEVTFQGNWEYARGYDRPPLNWDPLPDISPLKIVGGTCELFRIRCTTKPADPLTISSRLSASSDQPLLE